MDHISQSADANSPSKTLCARGGVVATTIVCMMPGRCALVQLQCWTALTVGASAAVRVAKVAVLFGSRQLQIILA